VSLSEVSPQSHNQSWIDDVRGVIAELEKLNRATETGFLAVGGNLMAFLSASRQLHADIAGLTALVSGEHAQHACNTLVSVRSYVQETQRRSEEGARALLTLKAGADRIRRGFSTFDEIASSFRMIAILARIEVAHLATSQQNLKNLADDVLSCSGVIGERAGRVLEVATDFDSRTASTLREVSRVEAIQEQELPSLLAAVDADMEVFQARQVETMNVSSKLAAELDSVARELGAVAVSIQFHDITRQQVEHVISALEGLLRDTPDGGLSCSGGNLVRLQKAQLQSAASAFGRSTKRIDRDLEGIAARVGEMAAAGNRIHSPDHSERDSFLGDMQRRFAAIARAVTELNSAERGARAVVADLQTTSQKLNVAVNEVQSIESQLGRISLNAVISASHIGAQGDALVVIAIAIKDLRTESALRSGDAKAALGSIGDAIASLAGDDLAAVSPENNDASVAMLIEDIETRVGGLESASASGACAAANVAAQADKLCANLQEARDRFGIGRLFAAIAGSCCDLLDNAASQAPPSQASDAPLVEIPEGRYTMEAERDVHRAMTMGISQVPFEGDPGISSAECMEDVEFF
jgi:hypothetical protein